MGYTPNKIPVNFTSMRDYVGFLDDLINPDSDFKINKLNLQKFTINNKPPSKESIILLLTAISLNKTVKEVDLTNVNIDQYELTLFSHSFKTVAGPSPKNKTAAPEISIKWGTIKADELLTPDLQYDVDKVKQSIIKGIQGQRLGQNTVHMGYEKDLLDLVEQLYVDQTAQRRPSEPILPLKEAQASDASRRKSEPVPDSQKLKIKPQDIAALRPPLTQFERKQKREAQAKKEKESYLKGMKVILAETEKELKHKSEENSNKPKPR